MKQQQNKASKSSKDKIMSEEKQPQPQIQLQVPVFGLRQLVKQDGGSVLQFSIVAQQGETMGLVWMNIPVVIEQPQKQPEKTDE